MRNLRNFTQQTNLLGRKHALDAHKSPKTRMKKKKRKRKTIKKETSATCREINKRKETLQATKIKEAF